MSRAVSRAANRAAKRATVLALAGTSALAGACSDFATVPDDLRVLEFRGLAFPAVVAGDTLRDSLGVALVADAQVFDESGNVVEGAEVRWVTPDTGFIEITPNGTIVARDTLTTSRNPRVFVQFEGLQSLPSELAVVARPDTAIAQAAPATLDFRTATPPGTERATSADIGLKLENRTRRATPIGVQRWLVSYRAEYDGTVLEPGDSTIAMLVSSTGRPTAVDTTDGSGLAALRLRGREAALAGQTDSVIVFASAKVYDPETGAVRDVPGAPARFAVQIRRRD